MENNSNDILIEYSETISASSLSNDCHSANGYGHANAICCDDTNSAPICKQECCESLKNDYDELYYVTKYKKCDEYCCAKKTQKESCYCEPRQECHYEEPKCDCCEEPKYDCCEEPKYDCCEKPKCDCCERPKHDCCEKPKCDCCERPKHDCCEKPKYDCCERPKHECCEKPKYDCCEKPKCNCYAKPKHDCCEKPKHDCCEKPKHDCCEKPKYDCCEKPKYDCCEKPKYDCCEKPKYDCCEKPKYDCYPPTRSYLKCGCPGSVSIPAATVVGTTQTLTALTLDTTSFKNPCIEFTFSSNINTTGAVIGLTFQIVKTCTCQLTPTPVGSIYTFSRAVAVTESDSFGFTVCDCDSCNDGCCTYSVIITTNLLTVGVTSISNAALTALVTDRACNC